MKNSKTQFIVYTAVIAAMYTALTYTQNWLLPGTTSAAVQFRVSEVLNILALFTPAAIPGLTIGCVLSNVFNSGALPVDFVVGSLATLLATVFVRLCRNITFKSIPIISLLMPSIFNGILVGWEIEYFFIDGPFHFESFILQVALVALGELSVMFVLGIPFFLIFKKKNLHKRLFNQYNK